MKGLLQKRKKRRKKKVGWWWWLKRRGWWAVSIFTLAGRWLAFGGSTQMCVGPGLVRKVAGKKCRFTSLVMDDWGYILW